MDLRAELETLRAAADLAHLQLPALRNLAAAALRTVPNGGATVDDVLQELCLDLLVPKRGLGPAIEALLPKDDNHLEALVRLRLHHIAVEAAPEWNLFRALQAQIRRALQQLPAPPLAPPSSLTVGAAGHLSQESVALAVAWLLQQPDKPAPRATEICRSLARTYFPEAMASAPIGRYDARPRNWKKPDEGATGHLDVERLWRAEHWAREWSRQLAPSLLDVLLRRFLGQTFPEIAAATGVSIGTVHARYLRAAHKLRSTGRPPSLPTACMAFELLVGRMARSLETLRQRRLNRQ